MMTKERIEEIADEMTKFRDELKKDGIPFFGGVGNGKGDFYLSCSINAQEFIALLETMLRQDKEFGREVEMYFMLTGFDRD